MLKGHATEEEMYKELLDTFFAGAETGDGRVMAGDYRTNVDEDLLAVFSVV